MYYHQSAEELAKEFSTDLKNGLNDQQVEDHLEKY